MSKPLPFFNWSLKKALDTEPDSFARARISIVFTILLFSLLKILVVIGIGSATEQMLQVRRAAVIFVVYMALTKVLLYKPASIKPIAHVMISLGIIMIWTNIFVFSHNVNIVSVQFAFMVALSSFYTMGSFMGIAYSVIGLMPILALLVFKGHNFIYFTNGAQEFASPGFEIIVILNFISMLVAHYQFYQAFTLNIQEKETLNKQLQQSVAEANKLAESRSNFLSTISHELRTPLNSVIGMAELLINDRPEPRHKENLEVLQFSALDLLSLINNVLDFNKVDNDKVVLEQVPFCLPDFMYNICSVLKVKAADKDLTFILDIDERLRATNVISDPTRLSQLIYNLVSNAIKFTDKGSVTVMLECGTQTDNGVAVLFSVTDTGIGIPQDRHEAIFDVFAQAETHTTRKYGGTGLGLAIVKQVLTLFGGNIELQSSPGIGTRFMFHIPFTTTTAPVKPEIENPAVTKTDLSHLKILIAEDNNFNRLIIKKQMDNLNLDPVIVENGQEAYDACLAGDYHAILLDLHMPLLDGYETTRQIRAHADPAKSGIHIIAFTASVTEQEQIMEAGFDDYLYKPVNMVELRNKLEKIPVLA